MTFSEYLRKNPTFAIIAISLATSAAFFVGATKMPPTYEANFSFTVDHRELQTPDEYAYDGYYALRASELFTDTVISWLKTPSILNEVRTRTSENFKGPLPDDLAFRVKKFSGQNIVVTISDTDSERAKTLSTSAIHTLVSRTEQMNQQANGDSLFVLKASDPLLSPKRFSPNKAGLIGLILGLVLGSILVFLVTPPKKSE